MGAETKIYGYICLDPHRREDNNEVLNTWKFDALYPFPNIFSEIRSGYGGDMISLAGSFKSIDEEWSEWEQRFEELLMQLRGRTAQIHLCHETDGNLKSIKYLCEQGWEAEDSLTQRSWTKWYHDSDGRESKPATVAKHPAR